MPVDYPKVAVLLAAYNGMQWIEDQVASILAQSAVHITLYISIDTSTDSTETWCAAYAAKHPCVVVLPDAGRFGGASRNFFRLIRDVDLDSFDFVALADQDDLWHVDKLQRAIANIEARTVDAYSSNVTAFWPNGRTLLLRKSQPQVHWDYLFEAAGPGCTYVMSNRLVSSLKASMQAHWQELQSVSLHDWYIYAFARKHGFSWFIDPTPSMDYRQHENNQIGANTGLRPLINRYKTIHDGWWFGQVQLIAALIGHRGEPFAENVSLSKRSQLIRLSSKAWQCRRRVRDKVLFFLICWVSALLGKKA